MLQEQINVNISRPDDPPDGLGVTLVGCSDKKTPDILLKMVRSVWSVVSGWGRWCDEELGEWPPVEDCLKSLPDWLQSALISAPIGDIENWLDDLHDRQWIWWSGAEIGSCIKIDLVSDSLPASYWTLEFVIESAGGKVIYKDMWIECIKVKQL